jgi:hypothetical protein
MVLYLGIVKCCINTKSRLFCGLKFRNYPIIINDKVCQWLTAGRWFSPGTSVSLEKVGYFYMTLLRLNIVNHCTYLTMFYTQEVIQPYPNYYHSEYKCSCANSVIRLMVSIIEKPKQGLGLRMWCLTPVSTIFKKIWFCIPFYQLPSWSKFRDAF